MLNNLEYRKLDIVSRLVYLALCQENTALVRVWPESLARDLNIKAEAVYGALYELGENKLVFYSEEAPLMWLPELPFELSREDLPKCELLQKALEFYGIKQAARTSLPAYFCRDEAGNTEATEKFKVKLEALRKEREREKVKAELEDFDASEFTGLLCDKPGDGGKAAANESAEEELFQDPDLLAADGSALNLLINFNNTTTRAEEELINSNILNSSSSAAPGLSSQAQNSRYAAERKACASSHSSSHSSSFSSSSGTVPGAGSGAHLDKSYPDPAYAPAQDDFSHEEYFRRNQNDFCEEEIIAKGLYNPFPEKAGQKGGIIAANKASPESGKESLDGESTEKAEEGKADLISGLKYAPYMRAGKILYFLNCQGGRESISAKAVEIWREAFPRMDIELELSGISVWLYGHYADNMKGGPLPGRANMENYIANCLRFAARKAQEGAAGKKHKGSRRPKNSRSFVKSVDALIEKALQGQARVNYGG